MAESILKKLGHALSALTAGKEGNLLGLSLGSSAIKAVELVKKGKQWKLSNFGMIQLPEDAIVDREIMNSVAVVESLKTLISQAKIKNKSVCLSISGASLIIKRMQVEAASEGELQDAVFWEAEQYISFDISDCILDFHRIGKIADNKYDVLLVAVKRSMVEAYMNCVIQAGLVPKVVDVDYFALNNLYEANYPKNPQGATCLVDIGAASTKLAISFNGITTFTKDVAMGGKALTTEIQKQMGLSYEDAEMLKQGAADGGIPQQVSELMAIMAENLGDEIKRTIDFYAASSSESPVMEVLISGGGSRINGLAQVIAEKTALPTQMINPFQSVLFDEKKLSPDFIAQIAPLAAIPVGLAIRSGE